MAFLAMKDKSEATRGAGCWSLDNKEKRKYPFSHDKRCPQDVDTKKMGVK